MSDTRKAEQQDVEKFVIEFFDKYPSCCGYPDCDGDLGNGEPHEKECPMYGVEEIPLRAKVVACVTAFAASQVQEPSGTQSVQDIREAQESEPSVELEKANDALGAESLLAEKENKE
jgi:hypothetical protein